MTKKRNLTLALDEDLLLRARRSAAKRRTSLTNLIRETIQEFVAADQQRVHSLSRLKSRMCNPKMQIGKARWTRDELHDR